MYGIKLPCIPILVTVNQREEFNSLHLHLFSPTPHTRAPPSSNTDLLTPPLHSGTEPRQSTRSPALSPASTRDGLSCEHAPSDQLPSSSAFFLKQSIDECPCLSSIFNQLACVSIVHHRNIPSHLNPK